MRTSWSLVLAAVATLAAPQSARAGVSVESVKVFSGDHGEQVALLLLKPQEAGNVLLRFSGTGSGLDGLALAAKKAEGAGDDMYATQWHGREMSFLQTERRRGTERWVLYKLGQLNHSIPLHFDEAATKALKAKEVVKLNESQTKDGTLAKFAAFHRDEEQAQHAKALAESAAAVEKACGGRIPAAIDWKTITDDQLKMYSIESFCAPPLAAMAKLCGQASMASIAINDKVKSVTCHFGAGDPKLVVEGGKLDWTINTDSANLDDAARKSLEALEVGAPIATAGPETPPWGEARTLGQRILLARAGVCGDGKGHYAVFAAGNDGPPRLYWGEGKKLVRVPVADLLGAGMFFDPRFWNPTANPSFRGADVRLFSSVELDTEKGACEARCGTRKTSLKVLGGAEADSLLTSAGYQPPVARHVPHALTRDEKGNYYYVDKGATPETEKAFRLFAGRKGALKLQAMTNVVSDSKGEIFSTKKGELRFIVGPNGTESAWVQGKKRTPLTAVPIQDNWAMIYNDLGVYSGERQGTPCDDL
jgi:hypothetical protein